MRAPEPIPALRVVATAEALDDLAWTDGVAALRLAPDELLLIGAASVQLVGEHVIVVDEAGFMGWWLSAEELNEAVVPHVDWPIPTARPALAQGLIAGVPAKLWLAEDQALLLCATAYAHELVERLP